MQNAIFFLFVYPFHIFSDLLSFVILFELLESFIYIAGSFNIAPELPE